MATFFGISHLTVDTYPQNTSIEGIAKESEYVLKRNTDTNDSSGRIAYYYTILDKNLEPYQLSRNGWSLCNFNSNWAYRPSILEIRIKDPDNKFYRDYSFKISDESKFFYINDGGLPGVNSLFELFVNVSNYSNWLDFLKTRPEVILDEKYNQNQVGEKRQEDDIKKEVEITSLKEELGKLKLENEALKAKLKQLEQILAKANRIFQKQSKKSGK